MTLPPKDITGNAIAINLTTWGDYQFAVWYTRALELRVGRIQRGVQRWGVNHQEYEFAGAIRTALGLPLDGSEDEHYYPAVTVDGRGHVHVWANYTLEAMRCVTTTTPHTTGDWLATPGWTDASADFPGVGAWCTYPTPIMLPDGGIWFYQRSNPALGTSGRGNSSYWTRTAQGTSWVGPTTLFQGLSVPDAKGPGIPGDDHTVDTDFNWSAYPTNPVVESARSPHPGRMHMGWCWRRIGIDNPNDRSNDRASYAYSDNGGVTWKAIDGTTLTLPITPLNNLACQTGLEDLSATGWVNWGGLAVDDDGLPHMIVSTGSSYYMRRNAANTAWIQSAVPNPLNGVIHVSVATNPFWLRGDLWMLKIGHPDAARRPRLWRLTGGTNVVCMGGNLSNSGFNPSADPEAFRRFGTVEVLSPRGDTPHVATFGRHARAIAAA